MQLRCKYHSAVLTVLLGKSAPGSRALPVRCRPVGLQGQLAAGLVKLASGQRPDARLQVRAWSRWWPVLGVRVADSEHPVTASALFKFGVLPAARTECRRAPAAAHWLAY
jgi:hypothetical protein